MKTYSRDRFVHSKRGAALMAVLWLIAILAIASMTALRVVFYDVDISVSKNEGSRAGYLAEMGIAVGANPAVKRNDPILNRLDEETGEGFEVEISSEGQRFNINAIVMQGDSDLLNTLFTDWVMELEDSQALIDALTDWIDEDDEASLNGAEVEDYEAEGLINQPLNRPFYALEEVRLVRGMKQLEALRPDWRDWFTVWSSGQLDLNDAPAELIAIAAECPIELAELVVESVCGDDTIRDTEDDLPFSDIAAALDILGLDPEADAEIVSRLTVNDPVTRIESIGQTMAAKRKITVILRNRTGRPALLERTEEIIP